MKLIIAFLLAVIAFLIYRNSRPSYYGCAGANHKGAAPGARCKRNCDCAGWSTCRTNKKTGVKTCS